MGTFKSVTLDGVVAAVLCSDRSVRGDACTGLANATRVERVAVAPNDASEAGIQRPVADAQDVSAGQARVDLCHLPRMAAGRGSASPHYAVSGVRQSMLELNKTALNRGAHLAGDHVPGLWEEGLCAAAGHGNDGPLASSRNCVDKRYKFCSNPAIRGY